MPGNPGVVWGDASVLSAPNTVCILMEQTVHKQCTGWMVGQTEVHNHKKKKSFWLLEDREGAIPCTKPFLDYQLKYQN